MLVDRFDRFFVDLLMAEILFFDVLYLHDVSKILPIKLY